MTQRTAPPQDTAGCDRLPVDLATMRSTVRRLLAADAEEPAPDEVPVLISTLRGHLELIIPEVESAAGRQKDGDPAMTIPVACAMVATKDVRYTLDVTPRPGFEAAVMHARRLARRLNAMCDHYEALGGEQQ